MLFLIAGVSGNLGSHLVQHALLSGHRIRGFGRSPNKLPSHLLDSLESFISCPSYTDPTSLSQAVVGVDAVICAYMGHPTAILDSQLALLRATEAAGIKIYHAHSYTCDWTKIAHGDWEHYDAYIAFRRHVELTSSIKPVYTFCGLLGEYALNPIFGIGHLVEDNEDMGKKVLAYWGGGTEKWDFTFLSDAAKFTIDLLTTDEAVGRGEGGFYRIHSGEASAKDLAETYERTHGKKVQLKSLGSVDDLRAKMLEARRTMPANQYFYYSHYFLQMANLQGVWKMEAPVVVAAREEDAVERVFTVEPLKGPV